MKKLLLGALAALFLSAMVITPASAAGVVTQTKMKSLPIAGDVTFNSAFTAADGDTITIQITDVTPVDPSVEITGVELVKVTPKPKDGCDPECKIEVISVAADGRSVDVTLTNTRGGKSKFHLWMYLSTDEHVGVNVAFGR